MFPRSQCSSRGSTDEHLPLTGGTRTTHKDRDSASASRPRASPSRTIAWSPNRRPRSRGNRRMQGASDGLPDPGSTYAASTAWPEGPSALRAAAVALGIGRLRSSAVSPIPADPGQRFVARLSENSWGPTTSCTSMTRSRFCAGPFRSRELRFGRLPRSCEVPPKRRCHFRTTARNSPTASRHCARPVPASCTAKAIVVDAGVLRDQSGYSSLRQVRGSSGWAFGVRSSRKLWYGATNGSGAITV